MRLDGGHGIETALNRRAYRRTALRLGGVNSRRCVIEQANTDQLLKRLGRLRQQRAGGYGDHDVIRSLPAELLDDFEGERLASFRIERAKVDVDDRPAVLVGQLGAEPVDVVVGAINFDDGGAVCAGGADLAGFEVRRDEDQRPQPCARRIRRNRAGEIAGRGTGQRVEAIREREVRRHRDIAVLE